jgi:uncharacterized membrane protein
MPHIDMPSAAPSRRVASVDVLRGLTMFLIIGFDGAMTALAEMSRDKGPVVSSIGTLLGTQFSHVACTCPGKVSTCMM